MPETVFERPTAFRAILRYWYLVLICALLGAACGAVYAFKRPPVYTATARLSAISVNASNAASLAGSLEAAQELASTFARVVQSTQVANAVANGAPHDARWAAAHVSGTPVPTSPFVTISANASSARGRQDGGQRGAEVRRAGTRATSSARRRAHRRCWPRSTTTRIQVSRAENHLGHLKGQARSRPAQQASLLGRDVHHARVPRLQSQIDAGDRRRRRRPGAAHRRAVRLHAAGRESARLTADRVGRARHSARRTTASRSPRSRSSSGCCAAPSSASPAAMALASRCAAPEPESLMAGRLTWLQTPVAVIAGARLPRRGLDGAQHRDPQRRSPRLRSLVLLLPAVAYLALTVDPAVVLTAGSC